MTRLTSPRYGISYVDPVLRNEPADVPADMKRLVDAIEVSAMYLQGTIAARPAAAIAGRVYYATNENILYYDTGTAWNTIGPAAPGTITTAQLANDSVTADKLADNVISQAGTFSARPAANAVPAGMTYFATDTMATYRSNGTAWVRLSADLGIIDHFALVPAAGWLAADNAAITPANTAATDLRAALVAAGSPFGVSGADPRVPGVQGRTLVAQDNSQTEFNALGKIGGAKTHPLAASEMPSHFHVVNGHSHGGVTGGDSVDHTHNMSHDHPLAMRVNPSSSFFGTAAAAGTNEGADTEAGGGGQSNPVKMLNAFTAGISNSHAHAIAAEAPNTNSQGGNGSHNNLQPFMALPAYIKL
jgi:microcystin-dependent protein